MISKVIIYDFYESKRISQLSEKCYISSKDFADLNDVTQHITLIAFAVKSKGVLDHDFKFSNYEFSIKYVICTYVS